MNTARRQILWMIGTLTILVAGLGPASGRAGDLPGFTEPYRSVDVAAADAAIIDRIEVREGDLVKEGALLAALDHRVLSATLKIADTSRKAQGRLRSAEADLKLKSERLEILTQLLGRGTATPKELDDAAIQKEIAAANVLAAEEELQIRELEYVRIEQQIEERMIRSPFDGVVVKLEKHPGEFVSPNNPVVLKLVQLDPLLAVFSVSSKLAREMAPGESVPVRIGEETSVEGTIETISPVTEAQSRTVEIKVLLPNPDGQLRAGEPCYLTIDSHEAESARQAKSYPSHLPRRAVQRPILELR